MGLIKYEKITAINIRVMAEYRFSTNTNEQKAIADRKVNGSIQRI